VPIKLDPDEGTSCQTVAIKNTLTLNGMMLKENFYLIIRDNGVF
jgi:hypothetical protein